MVYLLLIFPTHTTGTNFLPIVRKELVGFKNKHFKELRAVIRSSAAAARQAYALVAKAQTDTPSIKDFLKVLN